MSFYKNPYDDNDFSLKTEFFRISKTVSDYLDSLTPGTDNNVIYLVKNGTYGSLVQVDPDTYFNHQDETDETDDTGLTSERKDELDQLVDEINNAGDDIVNNDDRWIDMYDQLITDQIVESGKNPDDYDLHIHDGLQGSGNYDFCVSSCRDELEIDHFDFSDTYNSLTQEDRDYINIKANYTICNGYLQIEENYKFLVATKKEVKQDKKSKKGTKK